MLRQWWRPATRADTTPRAASRLTVVYASPLTSKQCSYFLVSTHAPTPCRPQPLAGMRTLGLQSSLTCEGVLQSARSIEAAFAPPMVDIGTGVPSRVAAVTVAAMRDAAVKRSRNLLDFVDHRADTLLLASGESGRWFVDAFPSLTGADANARVENKNKGESGDGGGGGGGGGGSGSVAGRDGERLELSGSSASESADDGSEYEGEDGGEDEEGEVEEDDRIREERLAKERELREREKEKEERDRRRAEAVAAAARLPPANDFVEELASIAWLPVHVTPPDDLLPWKVSTARLPRVCACSCWFSVYTLCNHLHHTQTHIF